MRALDLFCGAGGASMGLHRAGFDVTGIDIKPQPRYPFRFIQADALRPPARLEDFDFIWASPPCQAWGRMNNIHNRDHPKLIEKTRALLQASGIPYTIENVEAAPLINPMKLCGTAFNLRVEVGGIIYELRRHRHFECNFFVLSPCCHHQLPVIGVYGHGESKPMRDKRGYQISQVKYRREVMDMSWANRDEIAEAIPPAYSEFIGRAVVEMVA